MSTGYHKVAEIMTAHREMAVFERFEYLNTLNVLFMQAELTVLEEKVRAELGNDHSSQEVESEETKGEKRNRNGLDIKRKNKAHQRSGEEDVLDEGSSQNGHLVDMGVSFDGDKNAVASSGSDDHSCDHSSEDLSHNDDSDLILRGIDPRRDWYFLSTMRTSHPIWNTMLEVREMLKVYNTTIQLLKDLYAQPSPSTTTHNFLTHWFKRMNLGNSPLRGTDCTIYKKEHARSSLIALSPTDCPDPLSSFFLNIYQKAYHNIIGKRFSVPHYLITKDEEANQNAKYFEYDNRNFLRAADVVGSLISSFWLVASILILYYVKDMGARLAIIAVFTMGFGLVLSLLTRSRKAEVFSGCAAFAAVQVVFVSNIKN